ncbi:location of vulva defective 1-like [Stegodyphus dumicola]|uniref:location of vulva defective 1-like n=1 Tax=Stegodyphus dumicola TaxID=202533 RepID=UPI0015ABD63A|nr:location of vulva defective 1-like [Stegodyphus dumicola]
MTQVDIGILSILSIFFVVTFAAGVQKLNCDDVDDLLFSGRHPSCIYREALRRVFKLDKSFQFSSDRDYLRQIEVWRALQKSMNDLKLDHMKSKESPNSFNKKDKEDDLTSSKGNISSVTETSVDTSMTQQSSNIPYLRTNESFAITENMNTDSNVSSEKNYSEKTVFASSSITLDSTKLEIPKMQPSNSTIKEYNISTSSSVSARPTTYSTENVTVTLGSHINKTVSVRTATTAQNSKEIPSNASSSFANVSTANPIAVSVTNMEVISSDEAHTTSYSTYMESSSKGSNPASSNPVIKSIKPDESTTTAAEDTTDIADAISPTQKERTKRLSIKLILLATFLSIITISLAIILTYMIRYKRNDIQYDEVTLLP